MIVVKIVDSFNNVIQSSGPAAVVPRIGDKVDMRKYTPAPTVREVLWQYEQNGDVVVTVCILTPNDKAHFSEVSGNERRIK